MAKSLFYTFIKMGMEKIAAYEACVLQNIFAPEELLEIRQLVDGRIDLL